MRHYAIFLLLTTLLVGSVVVAAEPAGVKITELNGDATRDAEEAVSVTDDRAEANESELSSAEKAPRATIFDTIGSAISRVGSAIWDGLTGLARALREFFFGAPGAPGERASDTTTTQEFEEEIDLTLRGEGPEETLRDRRITVGKEGPGFIVRERPISLTSPKEITRRTNIRGIELLGVSKPHFFSLPRAPLAGVAPPITVGEPPTIITRFIDRIIYEILEISKPCPICPPEPTTCTLSAASAFTTLNEAVSYGPRATTDAEGKFALSYDCRGDAAGLEGCSVAGIRVADEAPAPFDAGDVRGVGEINLALSCNDDRVSYVLHDVNGDACPGSGVTILRSPDFACPEPPPPPPEGPTEEVSTPPAPPPPPPSENATPLRLTQFSGLFFRPTSTETPGTRLGNIVKLSQLTNGKVRLRMGVSAQDNDLQSGTQFRLQYGISFARYTVSTSIFGPGTVQKIGNANCNLITSYDLWRDVGGGVAFDGSMPVAHGTPLTQSIIGGISEVLAKRNSFTTVQQVPDGQSGEWDFPLSISSITPTLADRQILDDLTRFNPSFSSTYYYRYEPQACLRIVRADGTPLDGYGSYPLIER